MGAVLDAPLQDSVDLEAVSDLVQKDPTPTVDFGVENYRVSINGKTVGVTINEHTQ